MKKGRTSCDWFFFFDYIRKLGFAKPLKIGEALVVSITMA
jgi:hypothetical protein